jgi:D-alanine-D-alanine ligase
MDNRKKTVAVFFGAKSPEHDVSIVTGLQAIKALDTTKYDALPVYISPNGEWLYGEELLNLNNYMLPTDLLKKLPKICYC